MWIALIAFSAFARIYAAPLEVNTIVGQNDQTIVNGSFVCIIQGGNLTINGEEKGPLTAQQLAELQQYQQKVDQWTLSVKSALWMAAKKVSTTTMSSAQSTVQGSVPLGKGQSDNSNSRSQHNSSSSHMSTSNKDRILGRSRGDSQSSITQQPSVNVATKGPIRFTSETTPIPIPEIPSFCK